MYTYRSSGSMKEFALTEIGKKYMYSIVYELFLTVSNIGLEFFYKRICASIHICIYVIKSNLLKWNLVSGACAAVRKIRSFLHTYLIQTLTHMSLYSLLFILVFHKNSLLVALFLLYLSSLYSVALS